MKLRIKSMIWNIRKKKIFNQHSKKKKESRKTRIKDRLRSLWDNFKHTNIHINAGARRRERTQEIGNLFEEIMTKNFPNLVKELDIKVQEAQKVPNEMQRSPLQDIS